VSDDQFLNLPYLDYNRSLCKILQCHALEYLLLQLLLKNIVLRVAVKASLLLTCKFATCEVPLSNLVADLIYTADINSNRLILILSSMAEFN
jgi:hypothetical protein